MSTISDSKNGIAYLCIAFENFLKQSDAYLYFHLHHSMELPPAKLAYRWIIYAFVGILEPDQVLLLWDRMVGYDSTLILSVLAAALFVYRREALLQSRTEKDVKVSSLN